MVVTMGCGDTCPYFPGKRYEDWVLDDPAGQGVDAVRPIRDEIRGRVETLLRELGVEPVWPEPGPCWAAPTASDRNPAVVHRVEVTRARRRGRHQRVSGVCRSAPGGQGCRYPWPAGRRQPRRPPGRARRRAAGSARRALAFRCGRPARAGPRPRHGCPDGRAAARGSHWASRMWPSSHTYGSASRLARARGSASSSKRSRDLAVRLRHQGQPARRRCPPSRDRRAGRRGRTPGRAPRQRSRGRRGQRHLALRAPGATAGRTASGPAARARWRSSCSLARVQIAAQQADPPQHRLGEGLRRGSPAVRARCTACSRSRTADR